MIFLVSRMCYLQGRCEVFYCFIFAADVDANPAVDGQDSRGGVDMHLVSLSAAKEKSTSLMTTRYSNAYEETLLPELNVRPLFIGSRKNQLILIW